MQGLPGGANRKVSRGSHGDATVKEKSKVSKLPCFMRKLDWSLELDWLLD